ncbi:MAG TPA: hypothetical protein VEY12_00265 [Thermoplasmata archaeon]|nr:hypothetical protein [Thermoplasmata archaeon]
MRSTQEDRARAHLYRSALIFISAAVAFAFGAGFGYETLFFLWGEPGASVGLWGLYLLGFAACLWVTSVLWRNTRAAIP